MSRLDDAIVEFQRELKIAPRDPLTNMQLGRALVEARRNEEALPALELASRSDAAPGPGLLLPRPVPARPRAAGGGGGVAASGARAGARAGRERGPAGRPAQPARPRPAPARRRGGGRPRTSTRPRASRRRGRRARASSSPGTWPTCPTRRPAPRPWPRSSRRRPCPGSAPAERKELERRATDGAGPCLPQPRRDAGAGAALRPGGRAPGARGRCRSRLPAGSALARGGGVQRAAVRQGDRPAFSRARRAARRPGAAAHARHGPDRDGGVRPSGRAAGGGPGARGRPLAAVRLRPRAGAQRAAGGGRAGPFRASWRVMASRRRSA